jgi:hypothetical protein
MEDKEFKLPHSSFGEIKKLLIAYAKSKNPCSLDDLNKLTGINKTLISSNNGFLESIGAIAGGNKKEASEIGKKIGLALANNIESEFIEQLSRLLTADEFIESMITALGIKPRSVNDFQSHIAYSLGKELKGRNATGTGTIIDMLQMAGLVEEKDGLLYPKTKSKQETNVQNESQRGVKNSEEPNSDGVPTTFTKKITNELGKSVTLNINIQLTIPETENEKVYDNFFQAMKKHLLS